MGQASQVRLQCKGLLALTVFLSLGVAFAAGPAPVADISITPGQVSWTTHVKADRWLLTVSGEGVYPREIAAAGEPLRLQPNAPEGERLADGIYNWELRAIGPERLESVPELDQKPATIRQRSGRREVTFDRRAVERPVVTSGSFRVEGGAFVMPPPNEAGERR